MRILAGIDIKVIERQENVWDVDTNDTQENIARAPASSMGFTGNAVNQAGNATVVL